jgi:hypothetical protein
MGKMMLSFIDSDLLYMLIKADMTAMNFNPFLYPFLIYL